MSTLVNPVAMQTLFRGWEMQRELGRVADVVVEATKVNISTPHPRPWRTTLNPPPGPPHQRDGDLYASIQRGPALLMDGEMVVEVFAPAIHRSFYYAQRLLDRGYQFVDLSRVRA